MEGEDSLEMQWAVGCQLVVVSCQRAFAATLVVHSIDPDPEQRADLDQATLTTNNGQPATGIQTQASPRRCSMRSSFRARRVCR
jgi:hypothetical protein